MKLKHGKKFVQKTGSIWRLLFVFALFPWLRQYRILDDDTVTDLEEQYNNDDYDVVGSDGDSGISNSTHTYTMNKNTENALKSKIYSLNEKIARLTEMNKSLIASKR